MIFSELENVKDVQELIELCREDAWDKKDDAFVTFDPKVWGLVDILSPDEFYVFVVLARMIQRRNVLIITWEEAKEVTGMVNVRKVREIVNSLQECGLLTWRLMGDKVRVKERMIVFSPLYVWKGSYSLRNKAIKKVIGFRF